MLEMDYLVTDGALRKASVEYLYRSLKKTVSSCGGSAEKGENDGRCYFFARVQKEKATIFSSMLADKMADVIAVNFKYDFFKRHIRVGGLKPLEYELLLSALISADIDEDKRYVKSKLCGPPYALDGLFNFRMKPLGEKWREIVGYIPAYFAAEQLKQFVSYIVSEKKRGRVYVMGSRVYDVNYNLLNKAFLTGEGECRIIREVILSGFCEVELSSPIPERDEYYLKEFFGEKIFFGKGYFG